MEVIIKNNIKAYIDEDKYKELDLNSYDYSVIKSKKDLYRFLNVMKNEYHSREYIANQLIKQSYINHIEHTKEQYCNYDAVAEFGLSADELLMYEFHNQPIPKSETVILEYKYRTGTTYNQYNSVVIDNHKYDILKQIADKYNTKVMVCYLFKDNKIRMIDLFDNEIDSIMKNQRIKKNNFTNEYKIVDLYCFNNSETILI